MKMIVIDRIDLMSEKMWQVKMIHFSFLSVSYDCYFICCIVQSFLTWSTVWVKKVAPP